MSKLIVNEIEKYDAGQLTITTGTNVSVGSNLTVGGTISGTLSTAAQPNITSVGTLSSLTVTGDVNIDSNTLTVDSVNNKVGIGTTSFSTFDVLRVTGSNAVANDLVLATPNTAQSRIFFSDTDAEGVGELGYDHASNAMRIVTNGSERLRIDSSGNVLIGTSSASGVDIFRVNKDGTDNYSTVNITNANSTAVLYVGVGGSNVGDTKLRNNAYLLNTGNSDMLFGTNSAERMRIDSSGNVGIGVTPSNHHSLIKSIQIGTKANVFTYNNNTTDVANNLYFDSSAVDYLYLTSGAASFYRQSNGVHRFIVAPSGTAGTTVSSSEKVAIDSEGLKFNGDTAAANALDDYEEGTFTPTADGNTTAGTTTYTEQYGYYTKIGRQVNVTLRVGYSALTGTGALRIGNFPFAIANLTENIPVGAVTTSSLNWGGGSYIVLEGINNTTFGIIVYCGDDIAAAAQNCVDEAAAFRVSITYFTT